MLSYVTEFRWAVAILAVGLFVNGCSSTPEYTSGWVEVTPRTAILATEGVVISEANGRWQMSSGERFVPPTTTRFKYKSARLLEGDKGTSLYAEEIGQPGVFDVRISVPGRRKPLYGLMMFSRIPDTAEPVAKRNWRVIIKNEFVQAANGGLVSVTFQPFSYRGRAEALNAEGTEYPWVNGVGASWVLWMSDAPLY